MTLWTLVKWQHVQVVRVKFNNMKKEFIEGKHYYMEDGKIVFTALYHLQRGKCCGKKCRHCPFVPSGQKGATKINVTQN
jgi:hypothetical protein